VIIAERKPIEEIEEIISPYNRVLILGCGTCVTICFAGGEKEVGLLASELRMKAALKGEKKEIKELTVLRQCDWEFLEKAREEVEWAEVTVSLACGIGVQGAAEMFADKRVAPGVNTLFLGLTEKMGLWGERCAACTDCLLHLTAGICPITRCAKGLLNGPCGGSQEGCCEVSPDTPCAWQLIYQRLEKQGELSLLDEVRKPKDWSKKNLPGKLIRDDLLLGEENE